MKTPIFVLSLRNALDRRAKISGRLAELGLTFSFFDAIPVSALAQAEWAQLIDREGASKFAAKQMTDAEFSCALSHALIYRKIIEDGCPHAFILEDDAILSEDFAAFVSDRVFEASGEDIVSFYYRSAFVLRDAHRDVGRGHTLRKLVLPCDSTTGYFLSQRGARFLWKKSIPIRQVADWGADITGIGAKITSPCLVDHPSEENVPSIIEERTYPTSPSRLKQMGLGYFRYKMRKPFSEWIYSE